MIFCLEDKNLEELLEKVNTCIENDNAILLGNIVTVPLSSHIGFSGETFFEFKYLATMQKNESESF